MQFRVSNQTFDYLFDSGFIAKYYLNFRVIVDESTAFRWNRSPYAHRLFIFIQEHKANRKWERNYFD